MTFRWLYSLFVAVYDPSLAEFACALLTGLLGLINILYPSHPIFLVGKRSIYNNLLVVAFAAYPISFSVLFSIFRVWPWSASRQILLEISCLNGMSIEVCMIQIA